MIDMDANKWLPPAEWVARELRRRIMSGDHPGGTVLPGERRLAEMFKETGAHGIFAAMPLPHIWEPYPQVERTIEDAGMTYIDARKIDGVGPDDFPDGYHMGEKAKVIYSRFIAAELAERIRASAARPASRPSR